MRSWVFLVMGVGAVIAAPHAVYAQAESATIQGRVVSGAGAALAGVEVRAQSAALTLGRTAITTADGHYAITQLPPGEYVVSFERHGLVTVKRVVPLALLESVTADITMLPAERHDELISVSRDTTFFLEAGGAPDTARQSQIDPLPLEGGLYSAWTLMSAALQPGATDTAFTIDGAPVRLAPRDPDPWLLDPGPAAFSEATVMPFPTPGERLGAGSASAVTRSGGRRLNGQVRAALSGGDRSADDPHEGRGSLGAAENVDLSVGIPLVGQRTWALAALRRSAVTVHTAARLADAVATSRSTGQLFEAKLTHAFHSAHRLQAVFLGGERVLRDARPLGSLGLDDGLAAENRDQSHRVATVAYAGSPGGVWTVALRVSAERRRARALDVRAGVPTVRDLTSGTVSTSPGSCTGCLLDERDQIAWQASAGRLFSFGADAHRVTAGVDRSSGRLDGSEASPVGPVTLIASRVVLDGSMVRPVLEGNGSSWIVRAEPLSGGFTHSSEGLFVSDEWRRGARLTVRTGVRWDRQRLTAPGDAGSLAERSALSPSLQMAWRPSRVDGWTLFAGAARSERDLLRAIGDRLAPAGEWFAYGGPPINAVDGAALLDAAAAAEQALRWMHESGRPPRYAGSSGPAASLATQVAAGLGPTVEWTLGAARRVTREMDVRADFIWRRWRPADDHPVTSGMVDLTARLLDRVSSIDAVPQARRYTALAMQAHYDIGLQAGAGARYTLSRLATSGDPTGGVGGVPWAAPPGEAEGDRRHRLKLWGHVTVIESESHGTADVTLLQTIESGSPYGLAAWIDLAPWAPTGQGPAEPTLVPYAFTARDAFHGPTAVRTDLSTRYSRIIPGTLRTEAFIEGHVLNVFGHRRVVDPASFVVVQTAFTDPSRFEPFNPYTETPRQGVHWAPARPLAPVPDSAYTIPRIYRVSIGIRF